MPQASAPTAQADPYRDIQDALQHAVEQRPNYKATMDFHQRLETMFRNTPNIIMPIAAWHWDENFSTHVVQTPHNLLDGRSVYVAVTRCAHTPDLALMADSCAPDHSDLPPPPEDVGYDTSQRGTVTVCAVTQDPEHITSTVQRLAQVAAEAAHHATGQTVL